ncbi:TPA: hypothetical protein DDW35_12500 [Candidatus Sumerlaeota bacterium]|nr:hypothetical protein [Candidatus Sumerlaeota bacterium]
MESGYFKKGNPAIMSGNTPNLDARLVKLIADTEPILDQLGTELLLLNGDLSDLAALVSILEKFTTLKGHAEKAGDEVAFQLLFAAEEVLSGLLCERLPNPADMFQMIQDMFRALRNYLFELTAGNDASGPCQTLIEKGFQVLEVPIVQLPSAISPEERFIFSVGEENHDAPVAAASMPTMEPTPMPAAGESVPSVPPTAAPESGEEASTGLPEVMEDPSVYKEYVLECLEHLETIEEKVLELENNPEDINLIGEIFRPIHSMKGGAGFLGMTGVNKLAHDTETMLDRCRKLTLPVTPEVVEICLRSIDGLKQMTVNLSRFLDTGTTDNINMVPFGSIRDDIKTLLAGGAPKAAPAPAVPAPPPPAPAPVAKPAVAPAPTPPPTAKPAIAAPVVVVKKEASSETLLSGDLNDPEYASSGVPGSFGDSDENDLLKRFVQQCHEHLETIEEDILRLEKETANAEFINGIFRAIHSIKGDSGFLNLTGISKLAHETETLLDRFRKKTLTPNQRAIELCLQACDALKHMINNLDKALEAGQPGATSGAQPIVYGPIRQAIRDVLENREPTTVSPPKIGEILVAEGSVTQEELQTVLELQNKPIGEILVQTGKVSSEDLENALAYQEKPVGEILVQTGRISPDKLDKALEKQAEAGGAGQAGGSAVAHAIKVDTEKIDHLVNLVGELVIIETQVAQMANRVLGGTEDGQRGTGNASRLYEKNLAQLGKITKELQDRSMSLRMMPIRQTFQKMIRLVRDASKKMNKKVNLILVGEDTELDKTVVEQIGDPLVHMLRNSVDHGVEMPEERIASGKPETGTVYLEAFYQGDRIMIRVRDDGKGLDRERLIAKAQETGLLHDSGANLSDLDVFKFIFAPGFSTAKEITDISGRGVGMDVVRRNIDKLRGSIDIASEKGKGTTITISLPLTLAIIDGMIVRVGHEEYIIPTVSISESIRPRREDITTITQRGEMINVRGNLIPLVRLYSLWNIQPRFTDPCESLVVLVENDNKRGCLMVDELIGQQQIVIKNLGEQFGDVRGIAGATILGSGRVGLIIDVNGLLIRAQQGV